MGWPRDPSGADCAPELQRASFVRAVAFRKRSPPADTGLGSGNRSPDAREHEGSSQNNRCARRGDSSCRPRRLQGPRQPARGGLRPACLASRRALRRSRCPRQSRRPRPALLQVTIRHRADRDAPHRSGLLRPLHRARRPARRARRGGGRQILRLSGGPFRADQVLRRGPARGQRRVCSRDALRDRPPSPRARRQRAGGAPNPGAASGGTAPAQADAGPPAAARPAQERVRWHGRARPALPDHRYRRVRRAYESRLA